MGGHSVRGFRGNSRLQRSPWFHKSPSEESGLCVEALLPVFQRGISALLRECNGSVRVIELTSENDRGVNKRQ